MVEALANGLGSYLSTNSKAHGRTDHYGIRIENISPKGNMFDIVIIFKAGEEYCCVEPSCHIPLESKAFWTKFRNHLATYGVEKIPTMTVRKRRIEIEEGANFEINKAFSLPRKSEFRSFEDGPFVEVTL